MRLFWFGARVGVLLLLGVGTAHAYLDPGTGSALLQGVLGALAALAVALKLYWHRLLRLLGLRKKLEAPGQEQQRSEQAATQEQDSRD